MALVERPLIVRWVVGSMPHGGLIELILVTDGVPKSVVCGILSYMVHIKDPLLLIRYSPCNGGGGFPLAILVVRYHVHYITVNCVQCVVK